jgi:hypothetical protein
MQPKIEEQQIAIEEIRRQARINAMTDAERLEYQSREKRLEAKAAARAEKDRRAQTDKEQALNEEQENKVKKERRKRDVAQSNEDQREFYSKLGAPKILYQCSGSDLETAIGAKFGGINSLISKAQSECGEGNYSILKRKE